MLSLFPASSDPWAFVSDDANHHWLRYLILLLAAIALLSHNAQRKLRARIQELEDELAYARERLGEDSDDEDDDGDVEEAFKDGKDDRQMLAGVSVDAEGNAVNGVTEVTVEYKWQIVSWGN